MQQGFFATMHGGRARLAIIVVKLAIVLAVLVLLWQASAFFSLGIPILLFHVGALAAIAGLLLWQSAHSSMDVEAHKPASHQSKTPYIGIILHSAALYDMLAWFLTSGRERAFREKMLRFANLKPGEAVLDIGCGTGTVALLAKTKVGPEGRVDGVDASPEMVARATAKARRTGLKVSFSNAAAQQLPYDDGEFDLVLSTLMLHHLPKAGRAEFGSEAFRVLKQGGRLLVIDFAKPPHRKSFLRFHRHGHVDLDKAAADLGQRGFKIVEQGDVGTRGLRYLLAMRDPAVVPLAARGQTRCT